MTPTDAVEQYLASREIEVTRSTLTNHRYRLNKFLVWAEENGLDNMNEMSGRKCEEYKNWRIRTDELAKITLEQHLRTFRIFIQWCEANNAVPEGVSDKILIPELTKDDKAREDYIVHDRAEEIIDYISTFEFASLQHVIFHTLWHTGMRTSSAYALDLEDWHGGGEYLAIRNRDGTRLKLGDGGERNVTIADDRLSHALREYVKRIRPDVEDRHGREPLFATEHGRVSPSTIQKVAYRLTRPCYYSNECPHDRDIDSCEATEYDYFSKCPSAHSPHPIRRGAITSHLNRNVPMKHVSERMNVSTETLETHYDARTLEEKRENRKKYLNNL